MELDYLAIGALIKERPKPTLIASKGSDVVMKCDAEGFPRSEISWGINGTQTGTGDKYNMDTENGSSLSSRQPWGTMAGLCWSVGGTLPRALCTPGTEAESCSPCRGGLSWGQSDIYETFRRDFITARQETI